MAEPKKNIITIEISIKGEKVVKISENLGWERYKGMIMMRLLKRVPKKGAKYANLKEKRRT